MKKHLTSLVNYLFLYAWNHGWIDSNDLARVAHQQKRKEYKEMQEALNNLDNSRVRTF